MIAASALCALLLAQPAPAASSPHEHEVVFAAYNVQNWLTMNRYQQGQQVRGQPKPIEEREAAIRVLEGIRPDLLGIIEVGTREDLREIQRRLASKGLDLPHAFLLEAHDEARRIGFLSRFPIVANDSRARIPLEVDGRALQMQRGILDVAVEIRPGYELRLVGVHLKSKRPSPHYDEAALRYREARTLRNHVKSILRQNPETKLLLFGDLNATQNEPPVEVLEGAPGEADALTAIPLAGPKGDRWTHHWRYADQYSRIDFLMVSPALLPDVVEQRSGLDRSDDWAVASDHRALYLAIDPGDKGAAP